MELTVYINGEAASGEDLIWLLWDLQNGKQCLNLDTTFSAQGGKRLVLINTKL